MNRIVLGTVQLGLPYGNASDGRLMDVAHADRILDHAWSVGVRAFDTAEAYGIAAERLANWLRRTGRITEATVVTKVQVDDIRTMNERAIVALHRFEGAAKRTLFAHGFTETCDWNPIVEAARAMGADVGQSVYEPAEVARAVSASQMSRVQAPGNIFDDRARIARGESAVPLDLRSVFLQGILLLGMDAAERRVRGGGQLAAAVANAAASVNHSVSELLVAVMLGRLRDGDRLVVGADTPDHVGALVFGLELWQRDSASVAEFERQVSRALSAPPSDRLLDPRRWNNTDH